MSNMLEKEVLLLEFYLKYLKLHDLKQDAQYIIIWGCLLNYFIESMPFIKFKHHF